MFNSYVSLPEGSDICLPLRLAFFTRPPNWDQPLFSDGGDGQGISVQRPARHSGRDLPAGV